MFLVYGLRKWRSPCCPGHTQCIVGMTVRAKDWLVRNIKAGNRFMFLQNIHLTAMAALATHLSGIFLGREQVVGSFYDHLGAGSIEPFRQSDFGKTAISNALLNRYHPVFLE